MKRLIVRNLLLVALLASMPLIENLDTAEATGSFIRLASTNSKGRPANSASKLANLNGNGKVVTFRSAATNLGVSTNEESLIVKDLETETIGDIKLSVEDLIKISPVYNKDTQQKVKSSFITQNGSYAVVHLSTWNKEPNPSSPQFDRRDMFESILRVNIQTGRVRIVFSGKEGRWPGVTGFWSSYSVPIDFASSPNGRYVAYLIETDDYSRYRDIYVNDMTTNEVRIVSANVSGQKIKIDEWTKARIVSVSSKGLVIFDTNRKHLVQGDGQDLAKTFSYPHSYLKNPFNGEIWRVSEGTLDKNTIYWPGYGSPHVPEDPDDPVIPFEFKPAIISGSEAIDMSPDGRYILFSGRLIIHPYSHNEDFSGLLIRKDMQTGEVSLVVSNILSFDENSNDPIPKAYLKGEAISADGRYVLFTSNLKKLIDGDTNRMIDRFRKDMLTGEILRVSLDSDGDQLTKETNPDGVKGIAKLSRSGQLVAYTSSAKGLVTRSFAGNNVYVANMTNYPLPTRQAELERQLPKYYGDKTPPTLRIETPYKNKPIVKKRMVYLRVKATDTESGLSKVWISNNNRSWVKKPANALINWQVTKGSGVKKIYVKAIDKRGNVSTGSTKISIDLTKPIVDLTAPANNSIIKGKITFRVKATDPVVKNISSGIKYIEISRQGRRVVRIEKNNLIYTIDTTFIKVKKQTFSIKVQDKLGNVTIIKRFYNLVN